MALKAAVAVLATYANQRQKGFKAGGNFSVNDSQVRLVFERFLAALHS